MCIFFQLHLWFFEGQSLNLCILVNHSKREHAVKRHNALFLSKLLGMNKKT
ncbi:hypothetical protein QE357_003982 [Siphonobacter sp. BAB-5404]|nr:hypothetical protein [Siphonobacter sp. SORGH_AS_0500]